MRILAAAFLLGPLQLASPAWAHGDLHAQIEALTQRLAVAPHDQRLLLRRAELHRQHRDWGPALADFERVAALAPTLPEATIGRASVHLEAGRPTAALAMIDVFVEANPDHIAARHLRARVREAASHWSDAAADYARVIEHSREPRIEFFTALARAHTHSGRVDEAISAIDAGIKRLGPLVSLESEALRLERSARRWDAALARVDRLLAAAPRKESWIVERAEILRDADRLDEARRELPRFEAALATLAPHLRRTGAVQSLAARMERVRVVP